MPPSSTASRRKRLLFFLVIGLCGLLGYFGVGYAVYYWKEYTHHYESGVVAELFALHTMQNNYRQDHGSYASTFSQLGLPLGARLEGEVMTWNGPYRLRITRPLRDPTGSVLEYWIEARPIQYSAKSRRSFLMDHEGLIHFTSSDREATPADPVIPPER